MGLEHVLTKLRSDESVRGYALLTSSGRPVLSFRLPEEVMSRTHGTLQVLAASLRPVNVIADEGTAVLAHLNSD